MEACWWSPIEESGGLSLLNMVGLFRGRRTASRHGRSTPRRATRACLAATGVPGLQERFGLAAFFLEIFWRFPKNGVLAMKKWQQVGHQAGEAAKLQIPLKDGAIRSASSAFEPLFLSG
jgi:hypothetical protein